MKRFNNISIETALELYNCYILPTYLYGTPVWIGNCSQKTIDTMNSNFTKFLKRYLGVWETNNNAIIYFITGTQPLEKTLWFKEENLRESIHKQWLYVLNGYKMIKNTTVTKIPKYFDILESISTYFWRSRVYQKIPSNASARKKLMREVLDQNHYSLCKDKTFHKKTQCKICVCTQCDEVMEAYHIRFECNPFQVYPKNDIF